MKVTSQFNQYHNIYTIYQGFGDNSEYTLSAWDKSFQIDRYSTYNQQYQNTWIGGTSGNNGHGSCSSMLPMTDNGVNLGGASNRRSVVYSSTASINTSDENQKEQIAPYTDTEVAVGNELSLY